MVLKIDKKLRRAADRLIKTRPDLEYLQGSGVRFTVLSSDQEKQKDRKKVLGECEKVPDKYKWKMPYDFLIYIYEPNCVNLTDAQREILLVHELRHIGVDLEGKEPRYYVYPHDIEEFWSIIEEFGLDWQVANG